MATEFNAGSFIGRWVFALVLVLGTYNPTDYSYISWIMSEGVKFGPVVTGGRSPVDRLDHFSARYLHVHGLAGHYSWRRIFRLYYLATGGYRLAQPGIPTCTCLGCTGTDVSHPRDWYVMVPHKTAIDRSV